MANFNFNRVMLGGRLTGEPELRQTQSGIAVASFSIAVNRRFQRQSDGQADNQQQQTTADFFNITCWRQQAEFVARYFHKGSSIFVVGSVQNDNWTDQQGQKRTATRIIADEVNFVDSKGENSSFGGGQQFYQSNGSNGVPQQNAAPGQPAMPQQSQQSNYTPNSYNAPSYSNSSESAPKFEEMPDDENLPF